LMEGFDFTVCPSPLRFDCGSSSTATPVLSVGLELLNFQF